MNALLFTAMARIFIPAYCFVRSHDRCVYSAFNSWQETVHQQKLLRKFVRKLFGKSQRVALLAWLEYVRTPQLPLVSLGCHVGLHC